MPTLLAGKLKSSGLAFIFGVVTWSNFQVTSSGSRVRHGSGEWRPVEAMAKGEWELEQAAGTPPASWNTMAPLSEAAGNALTRRFQGGG